MIRSSTSTRREHPTATVTAITVQGFKSIADEQRIEVRPLTILAGPNSSGKSSMMQPLLLLKQTLEAQYDPGPLLLNGPNARFTLAAQFLANPTSTRNLRRFSVGISSPTGVSATIGFCADSKGRKL